MVKRCITTAALLILISIPSIAKAVPPLEVERLFGTYQAISLSKIDWCYSGITNDNAKEEIGKKIILSKKYASNFWREVHRPLYAITQETPSMEEGEVYPEHRQRLFEMNGNFDDELILLTVYDSSDNHPYETLEIVDNNTLLLEDGCWVYTLKRVKE